MVLVGTQLHVTDNSGALKVNCIKMLGSFFISFNSFHFFMFVKHIMCSFFLLLFFLFIFFSYLYLKSLWSLSNFFIFKKVPYVMYIRDFMDIVLHASFKELLFFFYGLFDIFILIVFVYVYCTHLNFPIEMILPFIEFSFYIFFFLPFSKKQFFFCRYFKSSIKKMIASYYSLIFYLFIFILIYFFFIDLFLYLKSFFLFFSLLLLFFCFQCFIFKFFYFLKDKYERYNSFYIFEKYHFLFYFLFSICIYAILYDDCINPILKRFYNEMSICKGVHVVHCQPPKLGKKQLSFLVNLPLTDIFKQSFLKHWMGNPNEIKSVIYLLTHKDFKFGYPCGYLDSLKYDFHFESKDNTRLIEFKKTEQLTSLNDITWKVARNYRQRYNVYNDLLVDTRFPDELKSEITKYETKYQLKERCNVIEYFNSEEELKHICPIGLIHRIHEVEVGVESRFLDNDFSYLERISNVHTQEEAIHRIDSISNNRHLKHKYARGVINNIYKN